MNVSAGDRIVIHTPGGGGYGAVDETLSADRVATNTKGGSKFLMTSGSLNQYTLNQESV